MEEEGAWDLPGERTQNVRSLDFMIPLLLFALLLYHIRYMFFISTLPFRLAVSEDV